MNKSAVCRIERQGDTYTAHTDSSIAWTRELRLQMSGSPFREEIVWPAASVVVIGGGDSIHLLEAASGAVINTIKLDEDYFSHFGPGGDEIPGDVLYVLGWRHVVALDATLAIRWTSHDLAVDGITWGGQEAGRIMLYAEMDPPGGWERVVLDAASGRELERGGE